MKLNSIQSLAAGVKNVAQQYQDLYEYEKPKAWTSDQIQNKITELPGYQVQLQQGEKTLARSQSARGILNSGQAAIEATKFGQGFAQQAYQGQLSNLAQLAGISTSAGQSALGSITNQGSALGSIQQNAGAGASDAYKQLGNAYSQAAIAQYQTNAQQSSGFGGILGSVLGAIL